MQAVIRKIGNSRGVIIPASFLAEAGLKEQVEITLKDDAVVITPIEKGLRTGWFENYKAEEDDDAWVGYAPLPGEEDEWDW